MQTSDLDDLPHLCTLQKRNRKQKMTYTGATGTVSVGQTVTGATSKKTAVVDKIGTGYVAVKTVSGTFTPGEVITTSTLSATFGTTTDYQNQSGEYEYYWTNDQTSVPCRFYVAGGGKGDIILESGQYVDVPIKCMFAGSVTITDFEYRIVSTVPGFVGTWDITNLDAYYTTSLHHFQSTLKAVV